MTELSTHTRKELAPRSSGGMDVTLIWVQSDGEDQAVVSVCGQAGGSYFEIPTERTSPSRSTTTPSPTATSAPSTTKSVAPRRSPMVRAHRDRRPTNDEGDVRSVSPERHDDSGKQWRDASSEEGLPRARAEVLASGLVDSDTGSAADEVLERLEKQAEEPSESMTGATGGDGHESQLRHPVRTVEHEVEHFRESPTRERAAATPAILSGGAIIIWCSLPPC